MSQRTRPLILCVVLALLLAACAPVVQPITTPTAPQASPTPGATSTSGPTAEQPLYVNILWHQHQPFYPKDANGVYTRPWARVHATKDYYDMAATVAKYPNVHVTFNLTPVLIRQLDDLASGAKDTYWVLAEKPAAQLNEDDKRFILQRFFDANPANIIARYPRYQELLDKRAGSDDASIAAALQSFSEQDFRDLQVWFNLAWFDPDALAQPPLKALVDKGSGFAEADKAVVFDQARAIIQQVIPLHKKLQDAGQIEVITSPYAHPILPLLYDTKLAAVGNPSAELPNRFSYPNDVTAQLDKGVQIYEDSFGQAPRGLWPSEGAVAQEIVPLVAKAGYQWMASGEQVLGQSLGITEFTRDANEVVQQADALYRPYYVTGPNGERVVVFFRDGRLSDLIGFEYSKWQGEAAAQDLIKRLEAIRGELTKEGATGPHVVSIILDGENAWENYPNDGKEFLNGFYRLLSESQTLKTVTPSEYLKLFPEQKTLEHLFPGAWFSPNYDTWIGEPEETQAWNMLGTVRAFLAKYDMPPYSRKADPQALAKAEDAMYLAEGSDWFWWFGSDQDSGQDWYFEGAFKDLLAQVYQALGQPVPPLISVPIIAKAPVKPAQALTGISSPPMDGNLSDPAWQQGALYTFAQNQPVTELGTAMDAKALYLKLKWGTQGPVDPVGIYLTVPGAVGAYPFTLQPDGTDGPAVGFSANLLFEVAQGKVTAYKADPDKGWLIQGEAGQVTQGADGMELSIPWQAIGEISSGDTLRLAVSAGAQNQVLPSEGPVELLVPELGTSKTILQVQDPQGDDHGPGSYTYPTDTVFSPGVFDLKSFTVQSDERNLIFKFAFFGAVPNPWGSPNNLALQTLDVYVDKDPGKGTGARLLLPGRNAALESGDGWDVALWAEGWQPAILKPDPASGQPIAQSGIDWKISVDSAASTVTLRVPLSAFGEGDPSQWGYVAAVLSQDGFPAPGVWRVRAVEEKAAQWVIGGGPADNNHTRILDLAWPADGKPTQEDMLSKYTASTKPVDQLTAGDFAQLKELTVP